MAKLVVDLSFWDGNVSVPKLQAAGVDAVIVKCGGGDAGINTDSKWASNYANCKAAKMPVGAYWYLGATDVETAKREAAYCIKLLKGKKFEYPIYVDVEEKAHQSMRDSDLASVILAFTDALEAAGYLPGVYSWKWLLEPLGSKVAGLEWWVCAWTRTKPCDCGMWQFGGEVNLIRSTTVAGYANMDQSYAYKDYPTIIKTAGLNGYSKGSKEEEPKKSEKKEVDVSLSVPEKIAQTAEHFTEHASHGYSQPNRGTGAAETITYSDGSKATISSSDIDCSEMVRQCVDCALSGSYKKPITYMWTGNENDELLAQGFKRYSFGAVPVIRGDVLLRSGHTAIATSPSRQAEACIDEQGGITGPRRGDQTGREVAVNALSSNWTYIYRYPTASPSPSPSPSPKPSTEEWFDVSKTVTFTEATNVRTKPTTKGGQVVAQYSAGDSVTIDRVYLEDGRTWGSYIGGSGNRRYVSLGTTERVR